MSEATYQIVFRGKLLSGFDRAQVIANLAQLFKSDADRIGVLLDTPKTVLKSGLSKDSAARYQDVLRQAGIMVAVVGDATAAVATMQNLPLVESAVALSGSNESGEASEASEASEAESREFAPSTSISELTLADAGTRIVESQRVIAPQLDLSSFSLAAAGSTLSEKRVTAAPTFDFAGLSVATDGKPIDSKAKPPSLSVDISSLRLVEVAPEPETAPTELQKLLSTGVE